MPVAKQIVHLDLSHLDIPEGAVDSYYELFNSAYQKILDAFANTNVEIVLEAPESGDYSTLILDNSIIDGSPITGFATFDKSFIPNDNGAVLMGNFFDLEIGEQMDISLEQLANLTANTIAHEIGHLSGLDHVDDPNDLMFPYNNDATLNTPPSFTPDQIQAINTNAVLANLTDLQEPAQSLEPDYDDVMPDDFDAVLDDGSITEIADNDDYSVDDDLGGL